MQIHLIAPSTLYRAQKRVDGIRRFLSNYMYYRSRNHSRRQSWIMARDTL